jgi:hypothetical protein
MKAYTLSSADLATLMSRLPAVTGPRAGFSYDDGVLTVQNQSDTDAIDAIVGVANWQATLSPAYLAAYAATARYNKEVGGTTVSGVAYPTDRETQAKLTAAYSMAAANSALTIDWKLANGTFATLTAAQVMAIAIAVGTFVQKCFSTEAAVAVGINASPPTISTTAEIDAQFAAFS